MKSLPISLLVYSSSVLAAQVLNPDVDSFIEGLLSEWGAAGGVSVAVVQRASDGEWNVETKGYGLARLSDNAKVTSNTLFPIASNSKLFATAATGLLVSNESLSPRISWDTKVASIIPDWELADAYASEKSSILDLMSHRTGLAPHDAMYTRETTLPELAQRMRFLKPSLEFRQDFQYNNIMYCMLGYLPEILTNTSWAGYVKKHILDPLGMTATTVSSGAADRTGRLAYGIGRENFDIAEGLPATGTPRQLDFWLEAGEEGNFISSAGGIVSSANDMAIWLKTLLLWGRNPSNNEVVIPEEVLRKVASGVSVERHVLAQTPLDDDDLQAHLSPLVYGGAQEVYSYRGHVIIEHAGDTDGAHSRVSRLPFDNIGVAVLTNDDVVGPWLKNIIRYRLIDEALGLEPLDWNTATKRQIEGNKRKDTPRPENPRAPSIPGGFGSLEGTYSNAAYGNWSLCLFAPSYRPSQGCKEMEERLPGRIDPAIPTLIAKVKSVWLHYILLQHFDGNNFNASTFLGFSISNDASEGYWSIPSTFSRDSVMATFSESGDTFGFGITGGFWGAAPLSILPGEDVKDKAEVWMEKVAEGDGPTVSDDYSVQYQLRG